MSADLQIAGKNPSLIDALKMAASGAGDILVG